MIKSTKIIFLPILVIIYLVFFLFFDIKKIIQVVLEINLVYFFLFVGLWSFAQILRTFRWHMFMQGITKKIPLRKNILYYLSGFSMVFSPGRIGEIIRSPYIKRDYGITVSKTASIVFIERFYDMMSILIIIIFAVFLTDIPKILVFFPAIVITVFIVLITRKEFFIKIVNSLS